MNSRYKIIFGCVIFNLFLEYWAHGMSYFLGTWYAAPTLSLLYLTYFSMLEDLIIRYRLRDYQVLNVGFVFGMFHETFNTGSVFGNRAFFGVDLGLVLLVNIGWWGFLQSVLAMYFANRLSTRDWAHSQMGKGGWILSVAFNGLVVVGAFLDGGHAKGETLSYVTALIIISVAGILFWKTLKRKGELQFRKSNLADAIITAQMILSIVMGTFFGLGNFPVAYFSRNEFAVVILLLWTLLSGSTLLTYRTITRKSICV